MCEELERVIIREDVYRNFHVGSLLLAKDKVQLVEFLKENLDIFVWNAYEVPRVDPEFIYHHLNVNPRVIPKKQIPQLSSKEHTEAIKDEVHKLK